MASGLLRQRRRRRLTTLAMTTLAVTALALTMSGCGEDPPEDYTRENGDAFLRACAEPLEDDLLHLELCQCVFDASQREIPYAEFVRIESRLRDEPAAPLPPRLVVLLAACVVERAEL